MTRKIIFKLPKKVYKKLSLTKTALALNRAPAVLAEIKELAQKQGLNLPVTIEITDETGEIEFTGAYHFDAGTSANLLVLVRDKLFTPEMAQVSAAEKEKFLDILQEDLALPLDEEADEAVALADVIPKEKAGMPSRTGKKGKRGVFRLILLSLAEILFLLVLAFVFKSMLKQNIVPSYLVGIGTSLLMFSGLMSVSIYLKKMSSARRLPAEETLLPAEDTAEEAELERKSLEELEADYLQAVTDETLPYPIEEPSEAIVSQDVTSPETEIVPPQQEPVEVQHNQSVIPIQQHYKNKQQNGGSQLSLTKADVTKRELSEHLKRSMSQATSHIQSQIDEKQTAFYELCQNILSLEDVKRSQALIEEIYQLELSLEAFQNGELIDEAEATAHAQNI